MKLIAILLIASNALAVCPKGFEEHEGVCASLQGQVQEGSMDASVASDEKPSKHPEPAWQRGEVNIVNVPNCAAEDIKADQERAQADKEGKLAAGIR